MKNILEFGLKKLNVKGNHTSNFQYELENVLPRFNKYKIVYFKIFGKTNYGHKYI